MLDAMMAGGVQLFSRPGIWLGFLVVPRGTATLRSLWQGIPPESARFRDRHSTLLAFGGIAVLIVALVVALQVPPFWT